MKQLAAWLVVYNPFHPPEARAYRLTGTCDGKRVFTSSIAEVIGHRTVRTSSGSEYELVGDPDQDPPPAICYWFNRIADAENPLREVAECLRMQRHA